MRDNVKDIEYFNDFINEELERVKKFAYKLEKGEVKLERIFPVKAKIHDLKLGILIAKYSKGVELNLLEKEYTKVNKTLLEEEKIFSIKVLEKQLECKFFSLKTIKLFV